ncbi:DUF1800 family protein [Undibacterium fentianense]|uniref:DUF1800 family protein n=1 Tax=Undibacterium fentianense TaxID=2828728 RepID=A0A941E0I1_9BURK|nr:DUF1800 family protein [Undibacterium fentianense]MBR7798434.1 DUF1800 family protein [Undibacterium fentianense]
MQSHCRLILLTCLYLICLMGLSGCGNEQSKSEQTESPPAVAMSPPTISNNVASFNGPRSNYTITNNGLETNVVDNVGSDGITKLSSNISLLNFTDVSINLTIKNKADSLSATELNALVELYIAYFNRVPDAEGLSYWIDRLKAGMTFDQIGESFYSAAILYSTQTGYSASMSNADFVRIIYRNVLGRPSPDQDGVDYWSQLLDSGKASRGTLVRTMLNSAHTFMGDPTYGWVARLLDNKNIVGKDFSVTRGLSYINPSDSISKGMSIAATVTADDISVAQGLIDALIGIININLNQLSAAQASRFLHQSTFGPTVGDITNLTNMGLNNWFANQFIASQSLHRNYMDRTAATLPKGLSELNQNHFFESFWQQAINGEDQLRQRVTFALSQIFVISFQDSSVVNYPRGVADYYDMLATHSFANFRQLLEAVSLHPMMGIYLTSLRNQKEAGTRVPDENYAREVMQLFTIGLYKLNIDGSYILENGKPVETYNSNDIAGLAKVFTGWSWAGPDKTNTRFFGGTPDPNRDWLPMQSYPNYHSTSVKNFLGTTIPAQAPANPEASLKIALDTLFNHPNVGPFIGKQLIQRLVTSNPSPQYVARVAAVFNNNGQGVRGDMKALIRAILVDAEARNDPMLSDAGVGKLREPVIRLANWLRAFSSRSTSGFYRITNLDDPLSGLAQTPMRSPSVFNFYRPGYVPPNSSIATAQLVSPEMQITAETSVVGYLNFMRDIIVNGTGTARDVKADYSAFTSLATTPDQLVDKVNLLLMSNQMSSNLRNQIISAINSIAIPNSPQTAIDTAKLNRVYLCVYLSLASPEYLVQK